MSDADEWRGRLGALWARHADALDQQLAPTGEAGLAALDPRPGEAMIDLGCGSGATSAGLWQRVAPDGFVLGLDLSADQIELARRRFAADGLAFEVADAGSYPFAPGRFDGLFSRFGCMFFDDPVAAFRSLRAALKPDGRAVLVVWRELGLNPWAALPGAIGAELFGPEEPSPPGAPGPFAWADPATFEPILREAGFRGIARRAVETSLRLGDPRDPDPIARAAAVLVSVGPLARRLRDRSEEERAEAARRLAPRLQGFLGEGWVRMPGAIWVVEARA